MADREADGYQETFGIELEGEGESEADLDKIKLSDIHDVSLNPTDWTVETIVRQLERKSIDISPTFQRRDVWDEGKKNRFIESLFMGLPVPQIVLAERERGVFIVIDGKQRLITLKQFIDGSFGTGKPFSLKNLEYLVELNGYNYDEIQKDPALENYLTAFENKTIRTIVIRNWRDDRLLYLMFLRLNQNSVQLSPQELRQVLHPGDFVQFVDEYCIKSSGLRFIFKGKIPDFRMRDMEIITRYIGFKTRPSTYSGNMKTFLDETTRIYNSNWKVKSSEIRKLCDEFDSAVDATVSIFGSSSALRKANEGGEFESRINRAIIDIMVFYFSDKKIRDLAIRRKARIKKEFIRLCTEDSDFREAIEATTKSMEATRVRYEKWGKAIRSICGLRANQVTIPKF